jgi:hypothetical protein
MATARRTIRRTKFTLPKSRKDFTHTVAAAYDRICFYVDGKEVWRSSAGGVSQVPEFLKLTNEIGNWAGDIKKAKLPDYFEVDYVRVYDAVE